MTPLSGWINTRSQKINKVLAKICLLWVNCVHEPIQWSFPWSHMYNWIDRLGSWNNTCWNLGLQSQSCPHPDPDEGSINFTPVSHSGSGRNYYHIKELKDAEAVVSIIFPSNSPVWSLEKRNRLQMMTRVPSTQKSGSSNHNHRVRYAHQKVLIWSQVHDMWPHVQQILYFLSPRGSKPAHILKEENWYALAVLTLCDEKSLILGHKVI